MQKVKWPLLPKCRCSKINLGTLKVFEIEVSKPSLDMPENYMISL